MDERRAYAGNLKTVSFANLLAFIARQKENGTLYLRRDKVDKAVQFVDGHPSYVASILARESFLRACVARGRTAVMVAVGLADQAIERGRQAERIALEQRLLSEEMIHRLVDEIQVVRLMELFSWRKGDFFFDFDGTINEQQESTLIRRPLGDLIQRGVRDHMDAGRVRALYREKMDRIPRVVARPTKESHGFTLKQSELRMLDAIDGHRTVEQVAAAGDTSSKETLKLLYLLEVLECIRVGGPDAPAVASRPTDEFKDYTFDVLEYSRLVDTEHARILTGNLFELFSIERDFDEETLRRNYYSMAQRFRPEEHYGKAASTIRRKADEIFEKLSSGYEALLEWRRQKEAGRHRAFYEAWRRIVGDIPQYLLAERDFLWGRDLMERGTRSGAREMLEKCVQARPDEGEYWAYLGYLQFHTLEPGKGRELAIVSLKRAQTLDSNSVAAYRFLAEYFEEVGKLGSAVEMMNRALRLRPGSAALRKAYKRLERLAGGDAGEVGVRAEVREIERRMQEFMDAKRDEDLYGILDLAPGATADVVRQAYFRAAKEFHPDRLSNISSKLAAHPLAEKIFQMINEAYEILSDDQRRAVYDRRADLKAHELTIRQTLERKQIEELIRRGETALREENYDAARDAFRSVLDMDPRHLVAGAYLAYTDYVLDGSVRESLQSYDERIKMAAQENPKSDTIELIWGMLHKRAGNQSQAIQHFQKAVAINENCVAALREIRLTHMRQSEKGGKESSKGGVLGGLFGRKKS